MRDVLGRDTREISAGQGGRLVNIQCECPAEIHKYKESVSLLSRTLGELGQEVSRYLHSLPYLVCRSTTLLKSVWC